MNTDHLHLNTMNQQLCEMGNNTHAIKLVYGIPRSNYKAIPAYKEVPVNEDWDNCPNCNLKPLIWEFDNGRSTACGCGKDEYSHPKVEAESIWSVLRRSENGMSAKEYDTDGLRKNWNHWCRTGEIVFKRRVDGRW